MIKLMDGGYYKMKNAQTKSGIYKKSQINSLSDLVSLAFR